MPDLQQIPITVQILMLDDALNEENIRNVHIIKMDGEGSDLLVLKGADYTLRSNNASLFMDVGVYSNIVIWRGWSYLNS